MMLVVKNPPDVDLIPGSGRSPGGRHGSILQYSCLENPMDRRDWRTTVHRVAKSQIGLKQISTHANKEMHMGVKLTRGGFVIIIVYVNWTGHKAPRLNVISRSVYEDVST